MHASSTELIGVVITAVAIIRFWRIVLTLTALTIVGAVIVGIAAVASYFHH